MICTTAPRWRPQKHLRQLPRRRNQWPRPVPPRLGAYCSKTLGAKSKHRGRNTRLPPLCASAGQGPPNSPAFARCSQQRRYLISRNSPLTSRT